MSRASFEQSTIDYEEPRIMAPRELTSSDCQRLHTLKISIQICRLIADRWMSLKEIGNEIRVDGRTVRRYIYALQGAGLDVVKRRPGKGQQANLYRVAPRSWHGLLYLPKD